MRINYTLSWKTVNKVKNGEIRTLPEGSVFLLVLKVMFNKLISKVVDRQRETRYDDSIKSDDDYG